MSGKLETLDPKMIWVRGLNEIMIFTVSANGRIHSLQLGSMLLLHAIQSAHFTFLGLIYLLS